MPPGSRHDRRPHGHRRYLRHGERHVHRALSGVSTRRHWTYRPSVVLDGDILRYEGYVCLGTGHSEAGEVLTIRTMTIPFLPLGGTVSNAAEAAVFEYGACQMNHPTRAAAPLQGAGRQRRPRKRAEKPRRRPWLAFAILLFSAACSALFSCCRRCRCGPSLTDSFIASA